MNRGALAGLAERSRSLPGTGKAGAGVSRPHRESCLQRVTPWKVSIIWKEAQP